MARPNRTAQRQHERDRETVSALRAQIDMLRAEYQRLFERKLYKEAEDIGQSIAASRRELKRIACEAGFRSRSAKQRKAQPRPERRVEAAPLARFQKEEEQWAEFFA